MRKGSYFKADDYFNDTKAQLSPVQNHNFCKSWKEADKSVLVCCVASSQH